MLSANALIGKNIAGYETVSNFILFLRTKSFELCKQIVWRKSLHKCKKDAIIKNAWSLLRQMRYHWKKFTSNYKYTQNLKADGSIYFVNPGYLHSACNLGNTDDIRLIFSVNGQNDFW